MGLAPLALPAKLPAAAALAFAPGSNRLLLATSNAEVLAIDTAESAVRLHSDWYRIVCKVAQMSQSHAGFMPPELSRFAIPSVCIHALLAGTPSVRRYSCIPCVQILSSMSCHVNSSLSALTGQRSGQTAAEQLSAVVSDVVVSPDAAWAALVLHQRVEVYNLAASKHHGRLPVFEVRNFRGLLSTLHGH